jgi:GNAT superfamily N-acetyltransferase
MMLQPDHAKNGADALRATVTKQDVEAVRSLVAATGFFSEEEDALAAELVAEALERGEASGYFFLFADSPHGLAGYTCYGPIPATQSGFDLYWIAVAAGQQGSGLGRRLLQASEADARARGAARMYVDTSGRAQYAPTRGFYEHMGYRRAAVLEDFYAPGDDKVIYSKDLLDISDTL